jgi:hypothetical protein
MNTDLHGFFSYCLEIIPPSLNKGELARLVEKSGFLGGNKFASTYMERDRKILKKWILGV